ncbi:PEP-CTERM sorting domain-containing protein [Roseateles sp. DB2]|uniref:PEP-CTERM sorting domain-containing protein n=1 Tax=Roseateles sp. DB2 TaxID=3453717 RepID=UPI003EEEF63A
MNFKHVLRTAAAAALVAASASASAGYVVLDGWQLQTPTTSKTNIGRLNLTSGTAVVEQQVNGLGQAFVGAKFVESGAVYSMSYTMENSAGGGDSGPPSGLGDTLTISFSNVAGKVVALNPGGGFRYQFTSGTFLMSGNGGNYASGSIVGLGGNASSTAVIGGFNGDSTLLAMVLNTLNPSFAIKDSLGINLAADMASGKVLFQAVTNNNTTGFLGTGACSFDATKICSKVTVASGGDAYLVRDIPEPASIALAGVALLGLGVARRRSEKK